MKKHYTFLISALMVSSVFEAQIFNPIATTGYNLDAVAETTTALNTTSGAIDGSNFVLYSVAYGALFNVTTGLPNSGLISSGTRTYQLQPYTQNNLLYLTSTQTGTISLNTPSPFAGLSLLGFATEGNATFDVTLRFTDNSTQTFTNQTYQDWFGTATPIISGFDRVSRTGSTPASTSGNPKMYAVDLPIVCLNRSKNVSDLYFQNTSVNARLCIMAISGVGAPVFSVASSPVTCSGGTNGSAIISGTGGVAPYTYTWNTTPVVTAQQANNLAVGIYSYSVQDNGGCVVTSTVAVGQSLVAEPNLTISANTTTICSGLSVTLAVSGAATYTWLPGINSIIYSPPALSVLTQSTITYTVSGLTSVNCLRTGSITVTVNPLPTVVFSNTIAPMCKNGSPVQLSNYVQPTGGVFSGIGVTSGNFIPGIVGTFTINYQVTDANNCSKSASTSVQVFSLAAPVVSALGPLCVNAAAAQITVNPAGGQFSGNGTSSSGLFNPGTSGLGIIPVGYTITSGPCTTSAGINVIVNAAPSASISSSKVFFCKNANSILLNGLPAGGTFSGPGMNGPAFNPSLAAVSNSNIIVYSYTDLNGCTDTASIRLTVSSCVGINEISSSQNVLNIFPNPSRGKITIQSQMASEITVINELGQILKTLRLNENNQFASEIELAAGIYFIRDQQAQNQTIRRFVILE